MRRSAAIVMTAAAVAVWGARAGADDVTLEASLAAMIRQFQRTADDFVTARRAVVRQRHAVLDETGEDTAQAHIRTGELKVLWRISGEAEKLQRYDAILAQSSATAESLADLVALVHEHRAAQAKLESAANFREDKLSAVAKALTVLGTDDSLEDLAKYYVQFVRETKDAVDAIRKEGCRGACRLGDRRGARAAAHASAGRTARRRRMVTDRGAPEVAPGSLSWLCWLPVHSGPPVL